MNQPCEAQDQIIDKKGNRCYLRECTDIEQLREGFPLIAQLYGQYKVPITAEQYDEDIPVMAENGYRQIHLFAEGSDAPLGVAGFTVRHRCAYGKFMEIEDLVVDENTRGRGLATILMEWLEKEAAALGCKKVCLFSGNTRTAAHHFYDHHGFARDALHFSKAVA